MKRWLVLAALAAQVLVLAVMAGQREWILRTGAHVLVRTAPVDPNDPMRGDYARLGYDISTAPRALCRDGIVPWFDDLERDYEPQWRDRRVYALLARGEDDAVVLTGLTDRAPASGLFLRGRVEQVLRQSVRVRYGIEALFMEQGTAFEFEQQARGDRRGVPLFAEVAVGSDGTAVLAGCRWAKLGMTMRLERSEGLPAAGIREGLTGAVLTLENHGKQPVAWIDLPQQGSFRLVVDDGWGDNDYEPVPPATAPPAPTAADVVVLQPGERREVHIDLREPHWFVRARNKLSEPVAMAKLTDLWGSWFRVEYAPPPRALCAGLPDAYAIQWSTLRSQRFNPAGGAD